MKKAASEKLSSFRSILKSFIFIHRPRGTQFFWPIPPRCISPAAAVG